MIARMPRLALAALLALAVAPLSGCEESPPEQKGPLVNPGPGPTAEARKPGAAAKKAPADPGPASAAKP